MSSVIQLKQTGCSRSKQDKATQTYPYHTLTVDEENQANAPDIGEILKELRELKELMQDMKGRQNSMEKAISKITKLMERKDFDLAKSTHAVNTSNILIIFIKNTQKATYAGTMVYQ